MNIRMHRGIPKTLTVFPGKTIILLRMLDWQIPGQFFLRSWTFRVHFNGKTAIQISCSSCNVPSILGSSWLYGMARNPVYILSTTHCYSKKNEIFKKHYVTDHPFLLLVLVELQSKDIPKKFQPTNLKTCLRHHKLNLYGTEVEVAFFTGKTWFFGR